MLGFLWCYLRHGGAGGGFVTGGGVGGLLHSDPCGLVIYLWRWAKRALLRLSKSVSIVSYGEYNVHILDSIFFPFT